MPVTDRNDGIEQWWIDTYEQNVLHELQQRESRLEGTCRGFAIDGEARRFNYIGQREMKPLENALGDTEWTDSEHEVRWAYSKPYYDAFLVDPKNVEKSFTDPSSDMTQESVAAARRLKDRTIIKAFKAPVIAGHDKDQILSFPADHTLSVTLGSNNSSNTGLNLQKLKEVKYRMDCADIDETDPRYFLISAKQLQNLLDTTEITNRDYNTVQALVEGKINEFLGFRFIRLELLPVDENIRSCFAYTRNSMVFGLRKGISVEAGKIPQKHFAKGVEVQIDLAALRLYDQGVYEIPCDETV